MANGPASGGRWIEVSPERLAGWLDSFAQRHGQVVAEASSEGPGAVVSPRIGAAVVTFRAEAGAVAQCHVPSPPLPPAGPDAPAADWAERIRAHANADRTVGVLLVRLGGYAAGVFTGPAARLAASKGGSRRGPGGGAG